MRIKAPAMLCILLLFAVFQSLPAERTISRSQDFEASTSAKEGAHEHEGLMHPKKRWSYYLRRADQREVFSEKALFPLSGFAERELSGVFQRHSYKAGKEGFSLIWNRNKDNPDAKWANADLLVFFSPGRGGTYSIGGDLAWRCFTNYDMRRGAGISIGIAGKDKFKSLFEAKFKAEGAFKEPKAVIGFKDNPALQNLKLEADDKIVIVAHSDGTNYRGLEIIDRGMKIVHLEGSPLPKDPAVVEDILGYQRLFSLMDLRRPMFKSVRSSIDAGEYPQAMEAYAKLLGERMSKFPGHGKFSFWLYGHASADELLQGRLKSVRYGDTRTIYGISIGKPGSINFFKALSADYRASMRDISSMHWTNKHAEAYAKKGQVKYANAWLATWDDFASNWESQYAEIKKDPSVWGKRKEDGRKNVVGIDWLNAQLYLAWRLESIHHGFVNIMKKAYSSGQLDEIDLGALARVLVRMAAVEAKRSEVWIDRAEKLVPNQIRHLAGALFNWGATLPEFKDSGWWRSRSLTIMTLTHNPDGTDREHSLNYFSNNLKEPLKLLELMKGEDRDEKLIADFRKRSEYRERYKPFITRPDGYCFMIGKNNEWRNYGKSAELDLPKVDFNSIIYPYAGTAVQRDGWSKDSLMMCMKTNRPSIGHWRSQEGSIQLSAYGRNLLVSSLGETYDGRDKKHGWSGYWYSSWGQNSILVDGKSILRRNDGFGELDDWLWHSSERVEFMETKLEGPYGKVHGFGPDGGEAADVVHHRQVHFLPQLKCWIITDRIDSKIEHQYTQAWNFGPEFSKEQVKIDSGMKEIAALDPKGPGISLYQSGGPQLEYEKHYGLHEKGRVHGWVGILADREKWMYTPAVDVHAGWRGKGKQLLITLLMPQKDSSSPLKSYTSFSEGSIHGFDALNKDGDEVYYRASSDAVELEASGIKAKAKSLLLVVAQNGSRCGMALGASLFMGRKAEHENFEFSQEPKGWMQFFSKAKTEVEPMHSPKGFEWQEGKKGLRPSYAF